MPLIDFNSLKLDDKTKEVLIYIAKNHKNYTTVTSFMKLAYFCDLISMKRNKSQITDFKYKRWKHGPFDAKIYCYLEDLLSSDTLVEDSGFTPYGDEFTKILFNEKKNFKTSFVSSEEKKIIDTVLNEFEGYSAKTLTDVAYKTSPMVALKAKQGGVENLNKELDLTIELD